MYASLSKACAKHALLKRMRDMVWFSAGVAFCERSEQFIARNTTNSRCRWQAMFANKTHLIWPGPRVLLPDRSPWFGDGSGCRCDPIRWLITKDTDKQENAGRSAVKGLFHPKHLYCKAGVKNQLAQLAAWPLSVPNLSAIGIVAPHGFELF